MQSRLLTLRSAFALTASLVAIACSGDPNSGFGVERAPIVYGEPSGETDDEVVEVVAEISPGVELHCSGTLIAPDVVLTALHCVTYREDANATFTCGSDGSIRPNSPNAGSLGAPVAGEKVQIFLGSMHDLEPDAIGVKVFGSGATQICRGDMAVVVLDRELSQDIAPVRFGRSVDLRESLTSIGFGQTELPRSVGRYRREVSVVDIGDVGCMDGSGPTPPDTFVVSEGPCHGDSGGPALSTETGAVVGVYSLSLGSSCTSIGARNTFALASSYEATIREALEFAGREPALEPDSDVGKIICDGTDPNPAGEGSGSREDPACTCRTAGERRNATYAWLALALAAITCGRRQRTRAALRA